jgi:hippurate hydrolase
MVTYVTDRMDQARSMTNWIRAHRRALHQMPEIGLELPNTQDYIATTLRDLGLEPEVHPGAGVTAHIPGRSPGTATVLRSDMDGLPVTEHTGLEFAADNGAMHACGHDLHMAMLLGAAACLVESPGLHDTVLAFQPGEEGYRGAVPLLTSHANLQIEDAEAFAIHVHATWNAGTVYHRTGPFMASGDAFQVTFNGPGGHGGQPHLVGNPIAAIADVVSRLRTAVAQLNTTEFVVATVTQVAAGTTGNVIPAEGTMRGTIRTLSPGQRELLIGRLQRISADAATETGLGVDVELREGYPVTVNDPNYLARLVRVLDETGIRAEEMSAPSTVTEDFSYFLQRWPGAMVFLGAQVPGHTSFNHAHDAVFDEDVLPLGAALHLLAADGLTVR